MVVKACMVVAYSASCNLELDPNFIFSFVVPELSKKAV
jgi:hypothetical protein